MKSIFPPRAALLWLLPALLTSFPERVAAGDEPLAAVLPAIERLSTVPRPDDYFGFAAGRRHVRHDQLAAYFTALDAASPRLALRRTGMTHEGRPLLLAIISAPANLARLDELLAGVHAGREPLVVWQAYSIHGNEASGSNAAPWVAWHWTSAADAATAALLERTVILIDPAQNPDGLDRFATWANGHDADHPVDDPWDREKTEGWPAGRYNHYWFDLNRDWLALVHPETRARVAVMRDFAPHVYTDHHEMNYENTFFFQPGAPARTHPLTPRRNQELTALLGQYYAAAFDRRGEMYFSREVFDDFYHGKGSTYPDLIGTVGILFEQGSSRGRQIATARGVRTFAATIANQVAASLATIDGADRLRGELLDYRRDALKAAAAQQGAWLFADDGDPERAALLLDILLHHGITVYPLGRNIEESGIQFTAGHAWVVPAGQPRGLLAATLFETRTEFADSTFYDVSAWTLPLAFDLPFTRLGSVPAHGAPLTEVPAPASPVAVQDQPRVLLVPWNQLGAAGLLQRLLADRWRVFAATRALDGSASLGPGTLVIPLAYQAPQYPASRMAEAARAVSRLAAEYHVEMIAAGSIAGDVDLGSPAVQPLQPPRPLMVTGPGLEPEQAGALWYLFDRYAGLTPTRLDWPLLAQAPLERYTHIYLADGDYTAWPEAFKVRLADWVRHGGRLIATGSGALWSETIDFEPPAPPTAAAAAPPAPVGETPRLEPRPYAEFEKDTAERTLGGAILQLDIDLGHPLLFGLQRPQVAVLKQGTTILQAAQNPYATPARYAPSPLLAGHLGAPLAARLAGQPALVAENKGAGWVIRIADPLAFRGHWLGSARILLNTLYFSDLLRPTELPPLPGAEPAPKQ